MDWSVFKLLLRQPLNSWKSLTRIARIQHIFLLFLIYAYLLGRVFVRLNALRLGNVHLYFYIIWGSVLALVFLFLITAPIFMHRLLPAQPEFVSFLSLPLRSAQLTAVAFYGVHKYWLLVWAVFLLLPLALLGQNVPLALLVFVLAFGADVLIFYFFLVVFSRLQSLVAFYGLSLGIIMLTTVGFYIFREVPELWPFGLGFLLLCFLLLALMLKRNGHPDIERWRPLVPRFIRTEHKARSANFLKNRFGALFLRDWLNHTRNPAYLKSKMLLLILLVISGVFVFHQYPADKALLVFSFVWLVLIWWHFSGAFSRYYAQGEPDWFLRLLPLPFLRFVLARFLNEYIFVLICLLTYATVLLFAGYPLAQQWQWLVLLTFFSAVILSTMMVFRIIFYDDPRTAGYAYHLTIIFFTVMSLNYNLVGPFVTIIFLLIFFYKSYRILKQ